MKNKNNENNNSLRFALLPLASLLYGYSILSLTTIFTILAVYTFRRDWAILDGITPLQFFTLLLGAIIFFPAKKFRERMLKNLQGLAFGTRDVFNKTDDVERRSVGN